MILIERMVLLMLEASPKRCMRKENLQSVLSVLNKRYRLDMENSLAHFDDIIRGLQVTYVDRTESGFVLNPGGDAELVSLYRRQAVFCKKFAEIAGTIFNRDIVARSVSYADVRIQMHKSQVSTHV